MIFVRDYNHSFRQQPPCDDALTAACLCLQVRRRLRCSPCRCSWRRTVGRSLSSSPPFTGSSSAANAKLPQKKGRWWSDTTWFTWQSDSDVFMSVEVYSLWSLSYFFFANALTKSDNYDILNQNRCRLTKQRSQSARWITTLHTTARWLSC